MSKLADFYRSVTVSGDIERGEFSYWVQVRFDVQRIDGRVWADLAHVEGMDARCPSYELTDDELTRFESDAIQQAVN